MFWAPLALAAAGGLMGQQKNKRAQQIEDADRKLQANLAKYSWIDGTMKADPSQIHQAGSAFGDIGQGALAGGMFGAQFMGGAGGGADKAAAANSAGKAGMLGVDTSINASPQTESMISSYGSGGGGTYGSLYADELRKQQEKEAMQNQLSAGNSFSNFLGSKY